MTEQVPRTPEDDSIDWVAQDPDITSTHLSPPKPPIQMDLVEPREQDFAISETQFSSRGRVQSKSLKLPVVLLTVLFSLPIVAMAAFLSMTLNQPLLALLLTSILTAIVALIIANRSTQNKVVGDRRHYSSPI